jgi:hypothetical protein
MSEQPMTESMKRMSQSQDFHHVGLRYIKEIDELKSEIQKYQVDVQEAEARVAYLTGEIRTKRKVADTSTRPDRGRWQ